jgi:hypothetical protein
MSRRNFNARLERLERRCLDPEGGLPPLFWPVVWGEVPLEEAPAATRAFVEAMFERDDGPDPIEEIIAGVALGQDAE